MKATDDLLHRLFKAAAKAPPPEMEAPPFALEECALEAWQGSRAAGEWDVVLKCLRLGLGFASVLMLLIIALSLRNIPKDSADEIAMPNVALNLALLQ